MQPTIYNIAITNANQEYSQAIPDTAKTILVSVRSGTAALKISYASGQSGSNYITIPAGASKTIDATWARNLTLYFQSPNASQVLEIEIWE